MVMKMLKCKKENLMTSHFSTLFQLTQHRSLPLLLFRQQQPIAVPRTPVSMYCKSKRKMNNHNKNTNDNIIYINDNDTNKNTIPLIITLTLIIMDKGNTNTTKCNDNNIKSVWNLSIIQRTWLCLCVCLSSFISP